VTEIAYDIAVIGGGVNGCGVARDAAGRGLSVFLAEKDDLASGTSSASTKLIHGGLRYLEHYEFQLVRESLREREVLWSMAPHIIHPLRFVLPHRKGLRPAWLIRLGLFLYDHLGGRKLLPLSNSVDLTSDSAGSPLRPTFKKAFEYSDCWVNDARLVVLSAQDAADKGAIIRTRTEVTAATRSEHGWKLSLTNTRSGAHSTVHARTLVNASGPWIGSILADRIYTPSQSNVRLVKGSHIVVPRMFDHDRAYIFQNPDQRIVFAIPYETDFTLIGTTDIDYHGRPEDTAIDDAETAYLCASVNEYFSQRLEPKDVVWSYSGIRPLYDNGKAAAQEATRDYVLECDGTPDTAGIVNVFGGKITTHRHLAEDVLDKLAPWFPDMRPAWTRSAALPGGDFPTEGRSALIAEMTHHYPQMPTDLIERLVRTYGTVSRTILGESETELDLGHHFGAGLYQREVEHLVQTEWAISAEDILWRRTKLGLKVNDQEVSDLESWLDDNVGR